MLAPSERGLLPPARTSSPGETGNLVQMITEWVLAAAMRECKGWLAAGTEAGVSVNLSPRSLRDASLPGLAAAPLRPSISIRGG